MPSKKPKPSNVDHRAAGKKLVKKRGRGYMAKIAQRGGETTRTKYGPDHMREISKLGVARRKAIYEAGRKALGIERAEGE